ncbi:MAG: putative transporter dipeptide/oligopeptide binding protein [Actinomycetia bacterium]|nr:putative transporter dipeptide/oligopeptide binding protein [Actinomycetes bacterium]
MRTPPGALLVPLLLAVAACGSTTASSTATGAKPVDGGTLTYAVNTEPTTCLDPHQSPADVAGLFTRPALDSLVALAADGTIHPWLATSWTVSKDLQTYTFTLRTDVRFSDGTAFDANAVKANLDHIAAPATKSQLAVGVLGPYTGTTVVNDHTAEVHFARPYSAFLAGLATAYFGIESPASLKQPEATLCSTKVIGSGPFIIDSYGVGQGISFHRNPAYHWGPQTAAHTGPAHLEKLTIKLVQEDSVRLGGLESGQFDAIASVPPVSVATVKANPQLNVLTRQAPGGNYNYYPNTTRGPFADVRVRKAFRDGIDFKTIIDRLYFGVFQPAKGALSPATTGYDHTVETQWSYNQAEANQLLDQAGYTTKDAAGYRTRNGQRLTVTWNFFKAGAREQRDTLATQIQAAAKQIGIDVEFGATGTVGQFLAAFVKGDYDLADTSWQREDADSLRTLFATGSIPTPAKFGINVARYSNPEVDAWLEQALAVTDPAAKAALYAKVQQRVNDDAIVFPVYVFNYVLGEQRKVHGIGWEPQAYPLFYDAWLAK